MVTITVRKLIAIPSSYVIRDFWGPKSFNFDAIYLENENSLLSAVKEKVLH